MEILYIDTDIYMCEDMHLHLPSVSINEYCRSILFEQNNISYFPTYPPFRTFAHIRKKF